MIKSSVSVFLFVHWYLYICICVWLYVPKLYCQCLTLSSQRGSPYQGGSNVRELLFVILYLFVYLHFVIMLVYLHFCNRVCVFVFVQCAGAGRYQGEGA